jgi:hypothetical protein
LSKVDQTVGKSFPLRISSVHWRAKSFALSIDICTLPFDLFSSVAKLTIRSPQNLPRSIESGRQYFGRLGIEHGDFEKW